jgi:TRAP transporter TAXI family solute receptor
MRRSTLFLIGGLSALVSLSGLGVWWMTRPTVLRVAVGPITSENVRVATAAVQALHRDREAFRLKLMITSGTRESVDALESGAAQLAILRADSGQPRNGSLIAMLYDDLAALIVPGTSTITSVNDLAGKTVTILRDSPGNLALMQTIIRQAGLSPESVTIDRTRPSALKAALDDRKVHAVLVLGPPTGRLMSEVIGIVSEVGNKPPRFLPLPDVSAIQQQNPNIQQATLVRGLFGGKEARPDQDVATVSATHLLIASKALSDATVMDFTRTIIAAKPYIAQEVPIAARMRLPDQEDPPPTPIHPGTISYINGQTTTFSERYGDWFYIGIMGLGLGGSLLAGVMNMRAGRSRKETAELLASLQETHIAVLDAKSAKDRKPFMDKARATFMKATQHSIDHHVDPSTMMAINMIYDEIRQLDRVAPISKGSGV